MSWRNSDITAAVDAAMLEMQNIHPPLKRRDCERLIRAALTEYDNQRLREHPVGDVTHCEQHGGHGLKFYCVVCKEERN